LLLAVLVLHLLSMTKIPSQRWRLMMRGRLNQGGEERDQQSKQLVAEAVVAVLLLVVQALALRMSERALPMIRTSI
jgi:hypothetical protein